MTFVTFAKYLTREFMYTGLSDVNHSVLTARRLSSPHTYTERRCDAVKRMLRYTLCRISPHITTSRRHASR